MRVLVTGATGFIGSNLVSRLQSTRKDIDIRVMTRNAENLKNKITLDEIEVKEADVMNYESLKNVLYGCDVAYYLIHSMGEYTAKESKKFINNDRISAENFAKAATECNVNRIIYLGGLVHKFKESTMTPKKRKMSKHMKSRIEVGNILSTSSAKVTIFRAAVIIGQDGSSFKILKDMVDKFPILFCPKWILTKCQPIALEDVITYLSKALEVKETEGRAFDIGGLTLMNYKDMMLEYANITNKRFLKIIIIPFLSAKVASFGITLFTSINTSLIMPLMESLKVESVVEENSIKDLILINLKTFKEAVITAQSK